MREATSRQHFRNRPSLIFMMLALWMAVTLARPSRRAYSKAARAIRMEALLGDDLQALHHAGNHFVLQAGVQVLGVLAEDGQVDGHVAEARLQARQHAHRPEVDVEPQLLAQRHVDALVAAGDGRGRGTLQADARDLERGEHVVGDQLALLGQRAHAGLHALPLDANAGGFHRAHGGLGHFGSDAVAGNERDRDGPS